MTVRILLVDDHQMMRDGLRSLLQKSSEIEIIGEAENGREAVEMVRKLLPDVVVMDVGMSEMNGIEATREIAARGPDTRIVALSTYSDKGYVLNMLEAGASAYVLKSAACEELERAVETVVGGKNYLSPEIAGILVEGYKQRFGSQDSSAYSVLSAREREVLQLLAEGRTSREIASRLSIAMKTVETHRRNIVKKLDLHSVAELTKYAVREGLTSLDG